MPAKRKLPRVLKPLQRRVLAEWRGVDEAPDLSGFEHRMGELLLKVLEKAGLSERCLEEELAAMWVKAVGEFLANNSKPVGWKDGVLIVAVLQPAIRYSLQGPLKKQILEKMRPLMAPRQLKDIRFQLG